MARLYTLAGIGAGIGPGTLNCPGDPDCPGYVEPMSEDYIHSLQDELTRLYTAAGDTAAPSPAAAQPTAQTFEVWLKAHQTAVIAAAAGLFVLAILTRQQR